jgi:glycosyltransferase involved in cell wall biosynthesis
MPTSLPLLSVIVCTFNRAALLQACIIELIHQSGRLHNNVVELLIVDNNSSDETKNVYQRLRLETTILRYLFESQQGLSYARNCGANAAGGTYLAYIDDDAIPGPQWLDSLVSLLSIESPDIAGGPVFPYYSSPKPFWFQDILETRRHASDTGYRDCPISGGNFIIRRDLLLRLGLFSPSYGIVGTKLRLGEDRNLLEKYRALTPAETRRIYYSQCLHVYHHVPQEKMLIRYVLRRAFESGVMHAALKLDFPGSGARLLVHAGTKWDFLRHIFFGDKGVYLPVRIAYLSAMMLGILFGYVHHTRHFNSFRKTYIRRDTD